MNTKLLKQLCEIPGIPGREERVRAFIEKEAGKFFDEMETDPLGTLICRKNAPGKGPRKTVLIAAHMDEIGFYVRHIDSQGYLWVNPAGGFDARNLFSRRVLVCTDKKDFVEKYIHVRMTPSQLRSSQEKLSGRQGKHTAVVVERTTRIC